MKEDSKRLLRGMTEVSDQYILEAEAFYQKKDEQNVDRENAVKEIKEKYPNVLLMADISTLEEAIGAEKAGVDFVGTTMNGYTPYTEDSKQFNPGLVKEIVENVKVPVIAEGKIHTPQQAKQAFEAGAHCIVVGGAITRPQEIATRFLSELR